MKYTPSIAFDEFAGSAKGVTAAKSRGRKYIRNKGYGNTSSTASQSDVKAIFSQLAKSFKTLTSSQIAAWNALAQTQEGRSTLGTRSKISGLNLYLRLNHWVVACGGTALATPPTLAGVESPASATLSLSASAFNITLDSIPADVTDLKLVVRASAPQTNGISDAYAKAAVVGDPLTPVVTAIELKTDYDAKYEAPSAAAPKVFVKWFYVNTTTGEKSGEMMGLATLSA
ncbi:MAG: hypothetical protein WCQ69_07045 [Bacteroidales bacterium]|jgi:hypothetical protein|nr:hypothetical protein [Bacteroidales bacterium]MDD2265152.1 hypothetical protein [Bacteroidales bacterium]MDD2832336.1 hypothetical protein [Bacteroidales bacterium]MDD3209530.1 hypothetical protein [Bacteroidales bacterium]MDD3698101.1 hypothetical protein [Bacteroidales bacterium]